MHLPASDFFYRGEPVEGLTRVHIISSYLHHEIIRAGLREIAQYETGYETKKDIDVVGFENVLVPRGRALETSLNERDVAYEGEIFRGHSAVTDRVAIWRSNITVVQSHALPVHPFDSHKRLLAILNDRSYISHEPPGDVLILNGHEWGRCFLSIPLGKPRYDDGKATEERNILRHSMQQDPHHKPEDWEGFLRSKRDTRIQHHRASHDELTNTIYNDTASARPSGLTATVPNPPYPALQPRHHGHSL
ncbi:uncharacterized protein ARMOST_17452 [Armillaria ostoyae]|uniref:Uncharacterized protein n=1 Tax=Armillaria ostoyae TaxID=47428 RepID=A0A284RZ62_ARMOS|nr:uncharacterized protein ARMOST_17452 [Armillaria ostoyae]